MSIHKKTRDNGNFLDQNSDQKSPIKKNRKTIKFSHLTLKNLLTPEKRTIFWCEGMVDFGIRVSPKGKKTWIFEYRYNGMGRRMTIGKFPKMSLALATKKYAELKNSVDMGIDPLHERENQQSKEKEELTVDQLVDLYLEHCKKSGKKSYKTDERELKKDLLPVVGHKKITEVQPKELAKMFHHIIVDREAPGAASHLYSYVRRLFNFAAEMGLMRRRDNPCLDIKLKVPKNRRQRHLNPKEIYLFWHTLDDILLADISRLALRFLLCTVARSVEVRSMKWTDIDMEARLWTLPTSKNGRMHRVYLGDLALDILKEAREYTIGDGYVFGSTGKISTCGIDKENLPMLSGWALSQPIRRHFSEFKMKERFYPHDLRRTGATMIAGLFGRRDFAAMALNHTNKDATDVYDQYVYDVEKKLALEALNKAIQRIIDSPNIESVPSFDKLREIIFDAPKVGPSQGQSFYNSPGHQSNFLNPVSYTLSYDRDVLKTPV